MPDLPRVYVTRRLPQPALDLLAQHVHMTVWPGELPPTPAAGGLVTSVTLLPHSPIPGHLVYEVKLTKPVKLVTDYLTGPVRLVIDLR